MVNRVFTIHLVQWIRLGLQNQRKKERKKISLVCSSSMLRVFLCALCFMSLLFEYMCMHLPFISWPIAGVPSSQALPGYLAFEPGYCTSICMHSWYNWRASCVDSKPKKNISAGCWAWIIKYVGSDCRTVTRTAVFGMYVAVLCLCPCVTTPRGFTFLPTEGFRILLPFITETVD